MIIVCIHGWSDNATSLFPLANKLQLKLNVATTTHINLGNYSSLDDNITFDDLAFGMMQAWKDNDLPTNPKSVCVVVHSMGALVLRYWLNKYFTPDNQPIKNCVMLAPANFGSSLAHKGKSLIGRLFRGHDSKRPLQVGSKLLNGLELGSPWLWNLANNDCFNHPIFNVCNILTTVFIGSEGNKGLGAILNEADADGVIRWSGASLTPDKYIVDFSKPQPDIKYIKSKNNVAFFVLDGFNHHTILNTDIEHIVTALTVTQNDFSNWVNKSYAMQNLNYKQCFIRCQNQYQQPIEDWCMLAAEFQQDDHILTEHFQSEVMQHVHVHSIDSSYKSFYLNMKAFKKSPFDWQNLHINFTALPSYDPPLAEVGYWGANDSHAWALGENDCQNLMTRCGVTFIDVILPKMQKNIFNFNKYKYAK